MGPWHAHYKMIEGKVLIKALHISYKMLLRRK